MVSGFVVVIDRAGGVDSALLTAQSASLRHRGSTCQTWTSSDGSVGLSQLGAQAPLELFEDRFAVVCDGDLNSLGVLARAELRLSGGASTGPGLLATAYAKWGHDFVEHLPGVYACAVWDAQEKRLFCTRDQLGQRGLYYAPLPEGRGYVLASEIKGVLSHPELKATPNAEVMLQCLRGEFTGDYLDTAFADVERLPPAHAMTVRGSGKIERRWRYWTLDFLRMDHSLTPRRAGEELRDHLLRACPISDSTEGLGCLVQGRISSNWLAHALGDSGAVAIGSETAARAAQAMGLETLHPDFTAADLPSIAREFHHHHEEPQTSLAALDEWSLLSAAKGRGLTRVVADAGARELLGGSDRHFALHQRDLVDRGRFAEVAGATLRERARSLLRRKRTGLGLRDLVGQVIDPEFPELSRFAAGVPPSDPGMRFRQRRVEELLYLSLPAQLSRLDRAAAAFSLRVDLPFLDPALVFFASRVHDDLLIRGGHRQWILRQAGAGRLPKKILWRPDLREVGPYAEAFRGELQSWVGERVLEGPVTQLDGYERSEVEALWQSHCGGEDHATDVWRLASLSEWLTLVAGGAFSSATSGAKACETSP